MTFCSLIFVNEIPNQRKKLKLFTTQLKALSINVIFKTKMYVEFITFDSKVKKKTQNDKK